MESAASSDTSNSDSWPYSSSNRGNSRIPFSPLRFFNSPVSSLLEYSGILRVRPDFHSDAQPLMSEATNNSVTINENRLNSNSNSNSNDNNGEVAIRIIGSGEQDRIRGQGNQTGSGLGSEEPTGDFVDDNGNGSSSSSNEANRETSSSQRYDIQQVARWIEQILPFALLLLMIFIRQHLQGFFITIWITAGLLKSNDILRKQTALKGERKISVLVGYSFAFIIHVSGIYWWCRNDDIFYPLIMIPPKVIPPFWNAIFIILVNDTMVRQTAMVLKLVLLMYYRNGRGHNFRRQGQMLTLVEYTLLLYRALLPTPVWYKFFLNKENGSLFSSLTTGLYLTVKLTSIVEKVQSFVAASKALSRKEVHYGSYATSEEEICVLYARRRCMPLSCCAVNISSVKTVFQNGLKGKELALCAGLLLDLLIFDHLGTGRQVFSSSYSNTLILFQSNFYPTVVSS